MFQKSRKNIKKKKRYDKKMFIFPLIVWIIGFIICFITFKRSSPEKILSLPSFSGYIMLGLGTGLFFHALIREKYRLKLKIGFPLKILFPAYPS